MLFTNSCHSHSSEEAIITVSNQAASSTVAGNAVAVDMAPMDAAALKDATVQVTTNVAVADVPVAKQVAIAAIIKRVARFVRLLIFAATTATTATAVIVIAPKVLAAALPITTVAITLAIAEASFAVAAAVTMHTESGQLTIAWLVPESWVDLAAYFDSLRAAEAFAASVVSHIVAFFALAVAAFEAYVESDHSKLF